MRVKITLISKGGGSFIHFVTTKTAHPNNITVVIKTSKFICNTVAATGGGLAIEVSSYLHQCSIASNRLLIENCSFDSK